MNKVYGEAGDSGSGGEMSHDMQKDHEMIYQQLCNIMANASKLKESCACGSPQLVEAWVQSKMTLADDYLDTVHDYVINGGHGGAGQDKSDNVGFVVAVEKAMTNDGSS